MDLPLFSLSSKGFLRCAWGVTKDSAYLLPALALLAPGLFALAAGPESIDHIAAAKAAEQSFHEACDEWSLAQGKGQETSSAAAKINCSYYTFMKHVLKTRYIPSCVSPVPDHIVGAGKLDFADGSTWSYLVGKDPGRVMMSLWKREKWQEARLPPHGIAASLRIESPELESKLTFGRATLAREKGLMVVRVPYKLEGVSGVIEIRQLEEKDNWRWRIKPDRGIVDRDGRWRPFEK